MYQKVVTDMDFAKRELEVASFWKEHDIMKKSFHLRDGQDRFTFYDGPPTANGKPHIGHVITRAMKDLIPRYHTMKGQSVLRIAGWDTHGLPVELEVEKKLGLDGKPAIEKYGIEPFIGECKKSVWNYLHEWEEMSDRVAYWLDMENPYVTYHDHYIESVWWSLKQVADKGLLYKGHKVVPYCPRCGTALSSHEVAQGYKEVEEYSAFVRFKVKNEENSYLLAWTTTPWTLPSNVALCVNAQEEYCRYSLRGESLILAKALIDQVFSADDLKEGQITESFKGETLKGLEYEPLFRFASPKEKAWYVVSDSYVTLTDGTGIVHIAPAFGEDDARIGRSYGLPFVQLVNTEGKFIPGTDWEGVFVKDADPLIFKDLKSRGLLHKKALFKHNYPHCWRCDTPLLYYARSTWFIKMTQVRDLLVENNRSVNWYPDNIKEGRMGNFVENVLDWGLSRERYWGTPLPVWICEEGHVHVIGSRKELEEMSVAPLEDLQELHRPFIDRVILRCPQCGKEMQRTKEVIDCWYDSGSMPFAQWHYPFENKEAFEEHFPADFISEAIDQTRGWFYTLLAIGTLVFDRSPFKNCLVLGHVQDKDGRKMSKHLGNVIDPWTILNKQGADATRWYFYTAGQPWLPSRFYDEAVSEAQRKYMATLWNSYAFYILYAEIDRFNPLEHPIEMAELTLMDRWILSRLNQVIKDVDEGLAHYEIAESAKALEQLVDELSNWYVRRSRSRFWGKGMDKDKEAAFITLFTVLKSICLLTAPFTPFIAEAIYQNLVRSVDAAAPESVHLCDFPVWSLDRIDEDMDQQMEALISVVQLGRACRNLANLKVRQPLSQLLIKGAKFGLEYAELAEDELNVKDVIFTSDIRAFSNYKLKPQLRTLGPRYGKLLGAISAALAQADGALALECFDRGEDFELSINGETIHLSKDDVLVETLQKPGLVSQEERGVLVALNTDLSEDLINEGFARELISKVQALRKTADFEVSDHIRLYVQGDETLNTAFMNHQDFIQSVTLSDSFTLCAPPESSFQKEENLNGRNALIGIIKI